MTRYHQFSRIYDAFMHEAPYDDWKAWLVGEAVDLAHCHIADIGCGTGVLTRWLAAKGRSVVGVDLSDEMLAEAAEQTMAERVRATWLCQDMRQLRLPSPVDLAVSTCDSLNYLLTVDDFEETVRAVHRNLQLNGWFCFDVLGPGRVEMLRDGFWYDLQDDAAVLFETQVADDLQIHYDVHAFTENSSGLYERFEEHHVQQFFDPSVLQTALEKSGFRVERLVGDFGRTSVSDADRLIFMARKVSAS